MPEVAAEERTPQLESTLEACMVWFTPQNNVFGIGKGGGLLYNKSLRFATSACVLNDGINDHKSL